eukprot:1456473-Rhodomonas_salina.1
MSEGRGGGRGERSEREGARERFNPTHWHTQGVCCAWHLACGAAEANPNRHTDTHTDTHRHTHRHTQTHAYIQEYAHTTHTVHSA